MFSMRPTSIIPWIAPLLACALGALLMVGTPWGLGLSPDSAAYLSGAKAFAETADFSSLPAHWPPLYPMFLAAMTFAVGDFALGARLLQAGLLALNVLLVARLLFRTGQRRDLCAVLTVAVCLQPSFIEAHLMLWSEPLFLSLALLVLTGLLDAIHSEFNRRAFSVLAGATALAITTRYAGLFLLASNAAALLVNGRQAIFRRLVSGALLGMLSLLPLAAWVLFNRTRGNSGTNREILWHPVSQAHLNRLLETVASWFHAPKVLGIVFLAVILAAAIAYVWSSLKPALSAPAHAPTPDRALGATLSLYILAYLALLIASISLADFGTPLDSRILLPVFPVVIALLLIPIPHARGRTAHLAVLGALTLALTLNIPASYSLWRDSRIYGLGFADFRISSTRIVAAVNTMPIDWVVATNSPELVRLFGNRKAESLPRRYDPGRAKANPDHIRDLHDTLASVNAVVFFTAVAGNRRYLSRAEDIAAVESLKLVYADSDGLIWTKIDPADARMAP